MKHIELKANPILWFVFITFFFVFASGVLLYMYGFNDLMLILVIAMGATSVINSILLGIHLLYNTHIIFTDTKMKIYGTPSKGISYNDIQKIRVNLFGFSIHGKAKSPIHVTNYSTNFDEAKQLLRDKIQNRNDVSFEGSNRLIHKYFIKE